MIPDIEATTSFRLLFALTSVPILNSVDFLYTILVPSSPKTRLLDASRLIHSTSGRVSVITTPLNLLSPFVRSTTTCLKLKLPSNITGLPEYRYSFASLTAISFALRKLVSEMWSCSHSSRLNFSRISSIEMWIALYLLDSSFETVVLPAPSGPLTIT